MEEFITRKKCALGAVLLHDDLENYGLLDTHVRFYFLVSFFHLCFSVCNYRNYTKFFILNDFPAIMPVIMIVAYAVEKHFYWYVNPNSPPSR